MPYYYATSPGAANAAEVTSNSSANTDKLMASWWTAAATARAYIQKMSSGSYATPADNAIRLRMMRITAGTVTAGSAFTPVVLAQDAPAANLGAQTIPTVTTPTYGNTLIQLAFNQRGTAMWAAFNTDEACSIVGAGSSTDATGKSLYLVSQSTGTSVPIDFTVLHSE